MSTLLAARHGSREERWGDKCSVFVTVLCSSDHLAAGRCFIPVGCARGVTGPPGSPEAGSLCCRSRSRSRHSHKSRSRSPSSSRSKSRSRSRYVFVLGELRGLTSVRSITLNLQQEHLVFLFPPVFCTLCSEPCHTKAELSVVLHFQVCVPFQKQEP